MHDEQTTVNPYANHRDTLDTLIQRRLSRRQVLQASMVTAVAVSGGLSSCATGASHAQGSARRFDFAEVDRGTDEKLHVPADHSADVLLRWGDPIFADAPGFDPHSQSAAAQAKQFGYNCDFIGYLPLPGTEETPTRGLLCVNHEYTSTALMFPAVAANYPASITPELCATEMAAHGGSVVEVAMINGRWQPQVESPYNRRIMADNTPMTFTGPAAGHPRLATRMDPDAKTCRGTLNNCAGGMTPWGTYLMAEENFHGYFSGELVDNHEADNHKRYGVPGGWFQWGRFDEDFNLSAEPNGPNRYGWIVEVDVLDPQSTPKKRTSMGRFKHEGAECVLSPDGRAVIYTGDDERFEYVYKFVSAERYDPENRLANLNLLENGTLYVARFEDSGALRWLPLIHGEGPLNATNGFASQADVMIETRRAADLLGATPMDRPEDIEVSADQGRAYVMLTNNTLRTADNVNSANQRPANSVGHIIEIVSPANDHAAELASWEILVQCGDPDNPSHGATWHAATSENGWFGSPDNGALDPAGRLWVATDGNSVTGAADGVWGVETQGPLRGTGYAFLRAPVGAEVCGPRFTPDGKTLFVSIQHPGDGTRATFENPTTRWPDFSDTMPPRPSVVAVTRKDGGNVGGRT